MDGAFLGILSLQRDGGKPAHVNSGVGLAVVGMRLKQQRFQFDASGNLRDEHLVDAKVVLFAMQRETLGFAFGAVFKETVQQRVHPLDLKIMAIGHKDHELTNCKDAAIGTYSTALGIIPDNIILDHFGCLLSSLLSRPLMDYSSPKRLFLMLPSSFLLDLLRLISANTSRYSESLPLMRLGFLGTSRAGKMATYSQST